MTQYSWITTMAEEDLAGGTQRTWPMVLGRFGAATAIVRNPSRDGVVEPDIKPLTKDPVKFLPGLGPEGGAAETLVHTGVPV